MMGEEKIAGKEEVLEGSLLEDCGMVIPKAADNYQAWQIYLKMVE